MFDVVIKNGIIVNASGIIEPPNSDIAIVDGTIACIGRGLEGKKTIDAKGGYITPGGIDGHVHLDQERRPGIAGDNFTDGTRSAICGGTTTVVCFAAQEKTDDSALEIVNNYHLKAKDKSFCDYGFHLIISKATDKVVEEELPILYKQGISSVKMYMSYEERVLTDYEVMKVLTMTRKLGMTALIHTENWDMIRFIIEKLEAANLIDPYYHAVSHAVLGEDEASYRAIAISDLMRAPILIVHVSTKAATDNIRRAQTNTKPVFAETCPQYLYLRTEKLALPDFEGAKYVCSPPLRDDDKDINALWEGLANGTFTVLSSDHCPFRFESKSGKKFAMDDHGHHHFRHIPNGLPGLEPRMVLGYQGVLDKRISMNKFVEVTSYNPSMVYGFKTKGVVAPGYDADLVVWYPDADFEPFTITNSKLHHQYDYTPYEGVTVGNWPRYTLLRGEVVWDRDNNYIKETPAGRFIDRETNRLTPHMKVEENAIY